MMDGEWEGRKLIEESEIYWKSIAEETRGKG